MKWDYLRRAYAISDYAYMRQTEAENSPCENDRTDAEADTFEQVKRDIEIVLEMAEDNFITARDTPEEYRTIRKCRKWLADFWMPLPELPKED